MHSFHFSSPATLLCLVAAAQAVDPTVSLASGIVVGTTTGVNNQPSVTGRANAYLGVPFASSPPLRFAPPTAPSAWASPLIAQTLPKACLQEFGSGTLGAATKRVFNDFPGAPPGESEDCLYLNVYAPQNAGRSNLKPVLVWLFGGNLAFGAASIAAYNGSSLAINEDVVVVVPNYRTNIFGFSNSPEIPKNEQNSGLLDQRLALQWVQDNIQAFGGDPSQVTLFGESAGAYSIKQLLANPPSPRPFRAAIMESSGLSPSPNSLANYNNVTAHFGCSGAASPIKCLRSVSATQIQTYINDNGLAFSPVNDAIFVGSNTLPQISNGQFANVPLLIGTNLDEASIFLYLDGLPSSISVVDQVAQLTGINISSIYPALLSNYSKEIQSSEFRLLSRIVTDLVFTCTTWSFSNAVLGAGRQPVWRYRYDGNFSTISLGVPNLGAYHSSEIPTVFGTYPLSNQYGSASAYQIALSAYTQHAWASFARDPIAGPGWPKLGSNFGNELGVLGGAKNKSGEFTQPLLSFDYPCPIYYPLIVAAGDAY